MSGINAHSIVERIFSFVPKIAVGKIGVKGDKMTGNNILSFTATVFEFAADKTADIFNTCFEVFVRIVVLGLSFFCAFCSTKFVHKRRPSQRPVFPVLCFTT